MLHSRATKRLREFVKPAFWWARNITWAKRARENASTVATLSQLGYFDPYETPRFLSYPGIVWRHWLKVDRARVLRGERRLRYEFEGREHDYVERYYLAANPDVATSVQVGEYSDGLAHFLAKGFEEVLAGRRRPFPEGVLPRLQELVEGEAPRLGRKLCYYAHFDRQDEVDPYVLFALETYRRQGFDIVFCTGTLRSDQRAKLRPLCCRIVIRSSEGIDFTSWFIGLEHGGIAYSEYERVLLANDSVYFPVSDADAFFAAVDSAPEDLWGITSSLQRFIVPRFHLQSYFLSFSRHACAAGLLEIFREEYRRSGVMCRAGFIQKFEYGITAMAEDLGLSTGALCRVEDLYPRGAHHLPSIDEINPTIHLWREILNSNACPILKVSLVRDNPCSNFDWRQMLELLTGRYPVQLIEDHQKRQERIRVN